jgi:hypothetical protein
MTDVVMALMEKQAHAIAEKLKNWNRTLKVEVNSENEVRASAKSITLDQQNLKELTSIVGLHTITFGRTGPNFRMIID